MVGPGNHGDDSLSYVREERMKRDPCWALQPDRLYDAAIDLAIKEFGLKPECRHDRHDIAVKLERIWNALELPDLIRDLQSKK